MGYGPCCCCCFYCISAATAVDFTANATASFAAIVKVVVASHVVVSDFGCDHLHLSYVCHQLILKLTI